MTLINVQFTRTDLNALLEIIETTGWFEGKSEIRAAIREAGRSHGARPSPMRIDDRYLAQFAQTLVPYDAASASLRSKINKTLATAAPGETPSSQPIAAR